MLKRSDLAKSLILGAPASEEALAAEAILLGAPLPAPYVALMRLSNGLHTDGNFAILEVEGVVQRNRDYEVQTYLPGYFMIGDDGGGTAMLIKAADQKIYEVGMGVMAEEDMKLSANSLEELVTVLEARSLADRGEW